MKWIRRVHHQFIISCSLKGRHGRQKHFGLFCFHNMSSSRLVERKHPKYTFIQLSLYSTHASDTQTAGSLTAASAFFYFHFRYWSSWHIDNFASCGTESRMGLILQTHTRPYSKPHRTRFPTVSQIPHPTHYKLKLQHETQVTDLSCYYSVSPSIF